MNLLFYISLFILFNCSLGISLKPSNRESKDRFSVVDALIKNIKKEKWREEDLGCFSDIFTILHKAKNSTLWATWVLDSMQLPNGVLYGANYQLGNYDQCMNAPWRDSNAAHRTKYCLVDVQITNVEPKRGTKDFDPDGSTDIYINRLTKHGRRLNTISWGVCVPSICTSEAISIYLRALLHSSILGSVTTNPQITVDDCQTGEPLKGSLGVKIFLYLMVTLSVIAIGSTWIVSQKDFAESETIGSRIAKLFCMKKNAYDLVKSSREDIPMLHGCRAMTAIILVFTHQVFFINSGAVSNGLELDRDLDMAFFTLHTDLLTDTFLMMSGLLLAKSLVTKEKLEHPLSVLWKRYIRLIGPMALLVFYLSAVSLHTGSGPLWSRLAGVEQEMCSKNWWLSLLMLNNYINMQEMCFITLWYIPVDFHLTILGLALIYIYRADRRWGMVTVAIVTVLAILLPAVATYWWRLPATIIYNVETMINIRQNINFNSTYIKSHYRIGSYLVGMFIGYFMAVYKPSLHRNIISKKLSIICFIVFFIVAWIPMSLGGVFYTRDYSAIEAAVYAASNRIVWAVAMSSLVVICEYGDLPIVNSLLSWNAWLPLSRLSYGLYLTHPVIILYNVFSARNPMRQHAFTMLSDSFGPIVLGYIFSLLIWLLVQAPIINLTNWKPRTQVHTTSQNGTKNSIECNDLRKEKNGQILKDIFNYDVTMNGEKKKTS